MATIDGPDVREQLAASGEIYNLFTQSELILRLAGRDLPLGLVRRTHSTARLETWPEPTDGDTELNVSFIPGSENTFTLSLVQEESQATEQSTDRSLLGGPRSDSVDEQPGLSVDRDHPPPE